MSRLILTFTRVPDLETTLSFKMVVNHGDSGIILTETFKVNRIGLGTVTTTGLLEGAMTNYNNAFNADWNLTLLFSTSYVLGQDFIIIDCNNPTLNFEIVTNNTAGAITTEIINNGVSTIKIDNITASQASVNPCDNVRLTVTTNETADSIEYPINQPVGVNPFTFEVSRSNSQQLLQMKRGVYLANRYFTIPFLTESLFDIQIINTPSGASLNINAPNFPLISFEYSLDNVTFNNIGTPTINLPIASYTLYIRDNLGCQISIPFEIDEFTPNLIDYDGICEISNVNSIRYKEDAEWSNCGIQKTIRNTLSFEQPDELTTRNYKQLFQKCDSPTTQIKTNYENIEAVIINCAGIETALTVNKMTDNMNQTDIRDAQVLRINGANYTGRLGVRFSSGNTYDTDTLLSDGTYNTGGAPLEWIDIDEYINIQGVGWLKVDDIINEPGVNGRVLVLNSNWSNYSYSQNETVIVTTIYNILDFERYEFTPSLLSLDGNYQIKVSFSDPLFGSKTFSSEIINVREEQPKCYVIEYYNTENNEINYSTGIKMILRIPYMFVLKWKPNSEQDIYVTDTQTVLMESKVREFYDFKARPLPTAMAQKLVLALSHDRLRINGENYLMEGEPENNSLGETNLNQIFVTLVRSDYVFDSNSGMGIGEVQLPNGSPLSINGDASGLLFVD